jgi:hypothetical protein
MYLLIKPSSLNDTVPVVLISSVKKVALRNSTNFSDPVLASGVNAIRWLLLGNKEKISNNYFIEYSNKLTDWKIKLTPRDSEVLSEISSSDFLGAAMYLLIKPSSLNDTVPVVLISSVKKVQQQNLIIALANHVIRN